MKACDRDKLESLAWKLGIDTSSYDGYRGRGFADNETTAALTVDSHDDADTLMAEGGLKFRRDQLGKRIIIY